MGSNQSTHKLTVMNENEDVNIIKISEGVAKRLSQPELEAENNLKSSRSEDVVTTYVPNNKTLIPEDSIYHPFYTISATQVHQEKEKQLDSQEEYWKNRLNNLKKQHEAIDAKLENEYNKAKNMFNDYKVQKIKERVDMCKEEERCLHNCYSSNKSKVLNCSEIFTKYADCINAHREKYMPYSNENLNNKC